MSLKEIFLNSDNVLLIDGGVSTHLEELLVQNGKNHGFLHREFWSSSLLLSNQGRDLVRRGHLDWIKAGADIISTVTYQCHYESSFWPSRLKDTSKEHVVRIAMDEKNIEISNETINEMWENGIVLAKQAIAKQHVGNQSDSSNLKFITEVPKKIWVAASSGCYGAILCNGAEYTGDYPGTTQTGLHDFHLRKIIQIIQCNPDAIAFETIPNYVEIHALAEAITTYENQYQADAWPACWISLACKNDTQLNDGTSVEEAVKVILKTIPSERVQGIGFNCCNSCYLNGLVDILIKQLVAMNQRRAIVVYPNSGEDWDAQHQEWKIENESTSCADMAGQIFDVVMKIETTWKSLTTLPIPVVIVGGCCRTRPSTIEALRLKIDRHRRERDQNFSHNDGS
jgi:homocysteine S-methyltransferase